MGKGNLSLIRPVTVVAFIALLSLSNLSVIVMAEFPPWINQSATTQYVTNLLNSYNALVDSKEALAPNFPSIEHDFSLYHDVGYSFKVLVVRSSSLSYNSNNTDVVAFIFTPIQSSQPQVTIDNNHTLEDFIAITPGAPAMNLNGSFEGSTLLSPLLPYGTAFYRYTMNQQDKVVYVPLVWVTSISRQVLNDTSVNSKNAAEAIYQEDKLFLSSATTSTTTQNPNMPGDIIANWLAEVIRSPISWLAGVMAIVIFAGIPWYFGSFREFVRVMGSDKERGKVVRELKRLTRHKVKKK